MRIWQNPSFAINVVNAFNWRIEYTCPQCGAPVLLEETDRLFTCPFCRVRLYLASNGCCHYYLPCPDIPSEQILLAPYWRFKGMIFSCASGEIKSGILDASSPASDIPALPVSLGLRTQVLRLRFVRPEVPGRFLSADLPFKTALSRIEGSLNAVIHPVLAGQNLCKAFIGETVSLVYAPLYYRNKVLYDAILGRPVSSLSKGDKEPVPTADDRPAWKIAFIPSLCPACGWDLEGERDSVILFCRHCDAAWESSSIGFQRFRVTFVPGSEKSVYLPFWRFTTHVNGLKAPFRIHWPSAARLPRQPRKKTDDEDLALWTPAFKIHPEHFLRSSRRLTVSQLREPCEGSMPKSSLHPVTLRATEAAESLKMVLAAGAIANRIAFHDLADVQVTNTGSLLVFVPFMPSGNELVQSTLRFSIHRNALQFGRNL